MEALTGRQLSDKIDPAGDNTHVLAAAYDLALEHVKEKIGKDYGVGIHAMIDGLKIDRSDMSSETEE